MHRADKCGRDDTRRQTLFHLLKRKSLNVYTYCTLALQAACNPAQRGLSLSRAQRRSGHIFDE